MTEQLTSVPGNVAPHYILVSGKSDGCLLQAERIQPLASLIIDATGCIIVPGLVDAHVHLIGGGGEAGPASMTPECLLSDLLNAGITTVVGVLGTDCVSRRQVALFSHL